MAESPGESVHGDVASKEPEEHLDNDEVEDEVTESSPEPDVLPAVANSSTTEELASNERIELVPPCFEEKGFKVQIHGGGSHFKCNMQNYVEMENGKVFHIELSNTNPYGCDVDIRTRRLGREFKDGEYEYGEYEDVGGWRLAPSEENFIIRNSGYKQGKFVFYAKDPGKKDGDTNTENKENMKSIFEITFYPEAYSIYFKMRSDKAVKNIRVLKKPESAKLEDVLRKWVEKEKTNEDTSGWCFFNGQEIVRTVMLLRTVANKQNNKNPLLLLKKKEKISVKSSDGNEIKEIEINPLDFTHLQDLLEKMPNLFGEGDYLIKVGCEKNYLKYCFEADFVEVVKQPKAACSEGDEKPNVTSEEGVKKPEAGRRGIELQTKYRGLDLGKQRGFGTAMFSGFQFRGGGDIEEEEVSNDHDLYREFENPREGVIRYEGAPVQEFVKVASDPNAPFYTSYEDKVEITIHLNVAT